MLSSRPRYLAKMYSGSRPATAGSILVDRKKNMTSVHFLIGRTDSAYAAGIASRITRIVEMMEAIAELINGGHGLAPEEAPNNSRSPSMVNGAKKLGGLVEALTSECRLVSTM